MTGHRIEALWAALRTLGTTAAQRCASAAGHLMRHAIGTVIVREADALRDRKKPAAAAHLYGAALHFIPESNDIRIQLGNMLKDSGNRLAALATYQKALEVSPDNADIHLQIGHALKLSGEAQTAQASYRRALALDPKSPAAGELLAARGPAALSSLLSLPTAVRLPGNRIIRTNEVEGTEAGYRSLGTDPFMIIEPAAPVAPGWYYIAIDATLPTGRPKLYFDFGKGFEERTSCSTWRLEGAYHAIVRLDKPLRLLRLDPIERPGQFQLRALSAHRIGPPTVPPRDIIAMMGWDTAAPSAVASGAVSGEFVEIRPIADIDDDVSTEYCNWVALYDTCSDTDRAKMIECAAAFTRRPRVSIIMPTYNTPPRLLREAIESVIDQTYDNWELCIADDCSTAEDVQDVLGDYARRDPRIKVSYRSENGHISRASNTAAEAATGEWIALLDHDDKLAPQALFCVIEAVNKYPDAKLFYSDEDKIDLHGIRHDPYFKSDWNPDLFRSHNLITHLGVYRSDIFTELGGFRPGMEGAQDYDLALRFSEHCKRSEIIHIPHILYHWRVMPGSTALAADEKPYAMVAGERALNDHLRRTGASAHASLQTFAYRVQYDVPNPPPRVSLIIPTRNGVDLLRQCIESILEKTVYAPYEIIIVDNGSDDPATLRYLKELSAHPAISILRDGRAFNYSALNNAAVGISNGTIIGLINNDIEVISPDWLTEMVSMAVRPEIGAVGARLWYPDDTLQHGGVILGLGGLAAHSHTRLPRNNPGYVGRAAVIQNFSAVTAACLLVRKELYWQVGGLNERDLVVAYNDVDFCLKLDAAGYRNIWTPYAELYHHESATRGPDTAPDKIERFRREQEYIKRTWPGYLSHDPAYNPNLSLDDTMFRLGFPPRAEKPWLKAATSA